MCWIKPACYPAFYRRDGQRFCAAVQARATSGLWQCPYSGLRNDPFFGQHYARLLWRLFFLFYYRARRRIIQSRSEDSIINEIEAIRDTVPGFTGVISDLGGQLPTCICCAANRHALNKLVAVCRAFIRIFVRTWTLTTNRRSTSIAVRVI
ncbi:radical SAM superfamily protein [Escherichia coli]|uniref:Radical SAM superfamily protein n=1 Tax=Escherichia coli TaxID=562 RepID=A0A2X3JP24_ECOLX|nr:radical SAM superfamily protein [Escherichia coli]